MNAHFLRKLWDVIRPKNRVDRFFKKVYNINVIKKKREE